MKAYISAYLVPCATYISAHLVSCASLHLRLYLSTVRTSKLLSTSEPPGNLHLYLLQFRVQTYIYIYLDAVCKPTLILRYAHASRIGFCIYAHSYLQQAETKHITLSTDLPAPKLLYKQHILSGSALHSSPGTIDYEPHPPTKHNRLSIFFSLPLCLQSATRLMPRIVAVGSRYALFYKYQKIWIVDGGGWVGETRRRVVLQVT